MSHHSPPSALGAPPFPFRSRGRLGLVWRLGLVLAAGLVAVGCADGDDVGLPDGGLGDGSADDVDQVPSETELTFGDPAEVGFAPVTDAEVEPTDDFTDEEVDLVADEPQAIIDAVADQLEPAGAGDGLLDTIEPVDGANEPATEPDGRTRNEIGELVVLDDEASLACAQTEIAIGMFDDGLPGLAVERLRLGADNAEASTVDDIRSWAEPLRATVAGGSLADPTSLVAFLTVCTEGGYEL